MFLYKNKFSSFENIWGGPGPPGPHGHDATVKKETPNDAVLHSS